jgi:tetratricopeptide (TPR) repeat protein
MPVSADRDRHTPEQYQELSYQYNIAGFGLLTQRRIREAIPYLRKAIEMNPDNAEAEYNMGNAMAISGRIENAIDHYLNALKQNPSYAEAHNNVGTIFLKKGMMDEAVRHLSEALRLKPSYQDAQRNLQVALKMQHQGK